MRQIDTMKKLQACNSPEQVKILLLMSPLSLNVYDQWAYLNLVVSLCLVFIVEDDLCSSSLILLSCMGFMTINASTIALQAYCKPLML